MRKKVLFCATVDYHFHSFHLPYLKWFKEQGWEVHVAASGDMHLPFVDEKYHIPIQRSPLNKWNITAYKQLKTLMSKNRYAIIHCHTPMGGVLARLAARTTRKEGTKVIYTAHGFHFCKGSPIFNWLVYYPIEKALSHFTDCLITINQEDYQLATARGFAAGTIKHVHGVGVDTKLFQPVSSEEKARLREKHRFGNDDFLMFYAAEFNKNKNQKLLIELLASVKDELANAKLLLAGEGELQKTCKDLAAKLGIGERVIFLGFRNDIKELLNLSDLAIASSFREGLPVNIMEAMSCRLPILASRNRGHEELVKDGENGFVISEKTIDAYAQKLVKLYQSKDLRNRMGLDNEGEISRYGLEQVTAELVEIYTSFMLEEADEAKSKHNRAYL